MFLLLHIKSLYVPGTSFVPNVDINVPFRYMRNLDILVPNVDMNVPFVPYYKFTLNVPFFVLNVDMNVPLTPYKKFECTFLFQMLI